jgi:hypothetical protein
MLGGGRKRETLKNFYLVGRQKLQQVETNIDGKNGKQQRNDSAFTTRLL